MTYNAIRKFWNCATNPLRIPEIERGRPYLNIVFRFSMIVDFSLVGFSVFL